MSIKIKKRYGKSIILPFTMEDMEKVAEFFYDKLDIGSYVLVTFKQKKDDDTFCGKNLSHVFWNADVDGLSIHCFLSNRSDLIPQCLILAYALVYAELIEKRLKASSVSVDKKVLPLVQEYLKSVGISMTIEDLTMCKHVLL